MTATWTSTRIAPAHAAWLAANLERRTPESALRSAHEITADEVAAGRALQRQRVRRRLPRHHRAESSTAARASPTRTSGSSSEESSGYTVPAPGGIATGVTIGIIVPTLLQHASEEQKRAWIPRMLSGEEIWVQLLSEPGAGSDLAGLFTRATRDGDTWVLNGNKVWSSGALVADYGVCLARTDWDVAEAPGPHLVQGAARRSRRSRVRPVREINGSAEFCEEFLDDVVVGDDMVIGAVNGGWAISNTMLAYERGGGARKHGGSSDTGGPSASSRPTSSPSPRRAGSRDDPGGPPADRPGAHQRLHAAPAEPAGDGERITSGQGRPVARLADQARPRHGAAAARPDRARHRRPLGHRLGAGRRGGAAPRRSTT